MGKRHVPFYRIIAVDSRKKRDGAFLDNLGTYDGINSRLVTFHEKRFDEWAAQGAQMSDSVRRLYTMHKASTAKKPVENKKKKEASASDKSKKSDAKEA